MNSPLEPGRDLRADAIALLCSIICPQVPQPCDPPSTPTAIYLDSSDNRDRLIAPAQATAAAGRPKSRSRSRSRSRKQRHRETSHLKRKRRNARVRRRSLSPMKTNGPKRARELARLELDNDLDTIAKQRRTFLRALAHEEPRRASFESSQVEFRDDDDISDILSTLSSSESLATT
jgi:hypothetical protein